MLEQEHITTTVIKMISNTIGASFQSADGHTVQKRKIN